MPRSLRLPVRFSAWELFFALLAISAAVPLWVVRYLPIEDLPQHLAAIRIIHDLHNPYFGFSQYFTVELGRTQYLTYYLAVDLLAYVTSIELANRLLLTAVIIATPYVLRGLLRALGRDERHALFILPLTWNAHLILGFFNFVAAIPLAMWALTLACRLRRSWSLRRAVGLAVLLLFTFYTHVVPFAFAAVGVALTAVGDSARETLRRWVTLVPAALAGVLWAFTSPAGQSTVAAALGRTSAADPGQLGTQYAPWMQSLQQTPQWLTDVLTGPADGRLLVAWGVLLLGALALGAANREPASDEGARAAMTRRLGLLVPLAAFAYFVTPVSHDWIWPINARFPLIAAVLLPIVLPPLRRVSAFVVFGAVALVAVLSFVQVSRAFVGFEGEVGRLDDAIAAIPPAKRVAGLIFDRGSSEVKFAPFLHSVAWYQERRGGAVMFTFADFPASPIRFRQDDRPPRVPPRWEWMPGRVDPARDLGWYDYVLVRGGPGRIATERNVYAPIFRSAHWSVWKRLDR